MNSKRSNTIRTPSHLYTYFIDSSSFLPSTFFITLSNMTISNNKKPEIALFQNAGIFKKTSALLIASKNIAPNAAPTIEPVPPF